MKQDLVFELSLKVFEMCSNSILRVKNLEEFTGGCALNISHKPFMSRI
jgi:hypothetical protein